MEEEEAYEFEFVKLSLAKSRFNGVRRRQERSRDDGSLIRQRGMALECRFCWADVECFEELSKEGYV